ncbi:hypothetical protein Tco_1091008 [Tanacetum coccineum]|uniref:Uncharacterized protein n=1 Tax=Tanacetum coccineum TaxID=301880 RepID=A0ABQ5I766_9ASTR
MFQIVIRARHIHDFLGRDLSTFIIDQGVTAGTDSIRDANLEWRMEGQYFGYGHEGCGRANPMVFEKVEDCIRIKRALTWWNSHVRIVGHDVAYAMTGLD